MTEEQITCCYGSLIGAGQGILSSRSPKMVRLGGKRTEGKHSLIPYCVSFDGKSMHWPGEVLLVAEGTG